MSKRPHPPFTNMSSTDIIMASIYSKGGVEKNIQNTLKPFISEEITDIEYDVVPLPNKSTYYLASAEEEDTIDVPFKETPIEINLKEMSIKYFQEYGLDADMVGFAVAVWNKAIDTAKTVLHDSFSFAGSTSGLEMRKRYVEMKLGKYTLNKIK